MIEKLRSGVAGWLAKALLALLIVSFALWGVGDMLRGGSPNAIARVGSVDIQAEEFRQQYQRQLDQLRRRYGPQNAQLLARRDRLDEQVFASLVNTAALDQHARELGLAVSQEHVIDLVKAAPMFRGIDGKFDRLAFRGALEREGLSEPQFVRERRADEIRSQVQTALGSGIAPPNVMIELLFKHRDESRSLSHFAIDAEKALKLPEPTPEQVRQVYEANKRQFVIPEQRKLAALVVTLDDIKAQVSIPDTDVQATYDAEKRGFEEPERRKLQQMSFNDAAAAAAAKADLAKGQAFAEVAKARGISESDIDLGTLAKSEMIDSKVADVAFALAKDSHSDVITGQFATVIVKVLDIVPGRTRPLSEVAASIKDRLQREQSGRLLQKLHDDVDRMRVEARPRKEIATALKVRLIEIEATDRFGNGPDGKPADAAPVVAEIAAAAHAQRIGSDGEGIEVKDGYAWVDALAAMPEREKPFEDVATDAKGIWLEQERRRALSDLGAKLVDRATKGETFEALAAEVGGKVEATLGVKRSGRVPGLSGAAVAQAFVLGYGQIASAESADGKTRTILRVDAIVPPGPPSPAEVEQLKRELGQLMENDLMFAYLDVLKAKLGVSRDEALMRRATGADTPAQ